LAVAKPNLTPFAKGIGGISEITRLEKSIFWAGLLLGYMAIFQFPIFSYEMTRVYLGSSVSSMNIFGGNIIPP
jgi:hypothetical protein